MESLTAQGDRLQIAQIGCGYWGPNLARTVYQSGAADLRWVIDGDPARRAFVARAFDDVATAAGIDVALEDGGIDAVLLATPAATHHDLALRALEAGKHVFVEKPLATTVADCLDLEAASRAADRIVMVGHTFLYNPAFTAVLETVRSGSLGELHHVYTQRLNLGQVRADVDAFWNLAPHDISMVLALVDDELPSSVSCRGVSFVQDGIADVAFADLEWPSGFVCHIHVSWLDPGKVRRFTVVGTSRMLVFDDVTQDKVVLFDRGVDRAPRLGQTMDFDQTDVPPLVYRTGGSTVIPVGNTEPLAAELDHFFDCVRSGTPPRSGIENGLAVVAVLEAARTSLESGGRPVAIADPRT